jgi:hypothetical protein
MPRFANADDKSDKRQPGKRISLFLRLDAWAGGWHNLDPDG